MSHLYELAEQYKSLQNLSDDDIDPETLADTLEGVTGSFEEKAIAVVQVASNISIEAIDAQIDRLQAMKKARLGRQEWLKEYLRTNMERTGITKIDHPLFSISLRKGRDIVSIDDESKIPADYLNIKTSVTPMKADILKTLKSGIEVPGCHIAESKTSLVIK
jgi:hypothetical protein